ncbi:hypothetical protein L204_106052 [Cryptococcus depauperatus]|nr:hypothetical protein L204_05182 [Cryptococcus depauperatus CBS 7855]
MFSTPTPNRIHHLPVRVSYFVPSSNQTYSTLFPALQQVYVHSNRDAQTPEIWGSIYLKTVVKGVLNASPEFHPNYPGALDLSLYALDPRETFFRRARDQSSRSDSKASSEVWTGKGLLSWTLSEAGQGKNLIAGRLEKASDFTSVIKTQNKPALEALMEAETEGDVEEESWGIEVHVGLNMGLGVNGLPGSGAVSAATSRRGSTVPGEMAEMVFPVSRHPSQKPDQCFLQSSAVSDSSRHVECSLSGPPVNPYRQKPHYSHSPMVADTPTPVDVQTFKDASTPIHPTPRGRPPKATNALRTRKNVANVSNARNYPMSEGTTMVNSDIPSSDPAPMSDTSFIPGPDNLTRDQAQRLLASPAFLDMLGKITGAPLVTRSENALGHGKRARDSDEMIGHPPKRKRGRPSNAEKAARQAQQKAREMMQWATGPQAPTLLQSRSRPAATGTEPERVASSLGSEYKCWNCGRTKSAVWRTKIMNNGQSVRVCNACGLYWNKQGSMRPPSLWVEGDDDRSQRATSAFSEAPSESGLNLHRAHRIDTQVSHTQETFKRTLSAVADQDARRMAFRHKTRGNLHSPTNPHLKPGPMTSPPRGSASATSSLRSGRQNAASSPGGFAEDLFEIEGSEPSPKEERESRNIHTRPTFPPRRLTQNPPSDINVQTLDLPLSDDGSNPKSVIGLGTWDDEAVAFFNVEGFSMPHHDQQTLTYPSGDDKNGLHQFIPAFATSSSAIENHHISTDSTIEEDTVLSQLFNLTSSINGSCSSPVFDFSQLPPSSPPISILNSDSLPHSALLLSSPMKKSTPNTFG